MSQFDETTKRKVDEYMQVRFAGGVRKVRGGEVHLHFGLNNMKNIAVEIRNSTKASLEVMAKALLQYEARPQDADDFDVATDAIAAVKANGDWPLEEKTT